MPFDPFDTELCAALSIGSDGTIRRAGTGCRAVLQLSPDALEGQRLDAVFEHPDRLEKGLANCRGGAPSAIVRTSIPESVRREGAIRVMIRMEPDGTGASQGVFALVEDVSARQTVMESSSQLASLVDFAADAWFVHDMEGRIRDANPWAAKSLGYTRDEMLELYVADFETTIQPGRLDGVWNRMDVGKPVSVTGRHRRKDGVTFPVSVRLGLFETDDGEVLMLAICRDITEQKRNEDRLEALNERLEDEVAERTAQLRETMGERQAILDHLADGLVAFDTDMAVRLANPALEGLIGHPVALGPGGTVGLPEALRTLARTALSTRSVQRGEIALDGSGSTRTAQVVASPTFREGSEQSVLGAVALVRDITHEREVDRMKTDFIATVSHELRTPLTSVLGFAKITRNKLGSTVFPHVPETDRKAQRGVKQAVRNLDIIVSEGERLTSLINDVLDISKMEAGRVDWRFGDVDPGALAERAVTATSALFPVEDGEVVFRFEREADLPLVALDPDRILQVLINLISNAAKFTERGAVTLEVRSSRTSSGADGVVFSVSDTGRGIAPSEIDVVFDKFRQVGDTLTDKPQGTGLGLPICAQIVAAHGSRFELDSTPGAGSRFAFVLPCARAEPVSAVGAPEPVPSETSSSGVVETTDDLDGVDTSEERADRAEILVVDDDPSLRELLRQQLTERGYAVRLASNGYEAIGMARSSRPSLVVLDVMMPVLSGFDVAAMLKNDPVTEAVPILMLSIVRDEARGARIGVDRYFTKPADADAIALAVADLLTGTRAP